MRAKKIKNNGIFDKNGNKYSVEFTSGNGIFNDKTKEEILSINAPTLNIYQKVGNPRVKVASEESSKAPNLLEKETFKAFVEIGRGPICMDVMVDPTVNVKCLHKFGSNCIHTWVANKKTCPICKMVVGTRRFLAPDTRMKALIDLLIPDLESFREFEQIEANRQIQSKNEIKRKREFKKLQNKQVLKTDKILLEKQKEKEEKERRRAKKLRDKIRKELKNSRAFTNGDGNGTSKDDQNQNKRRKNH